MTAIGLIAVQTGSCWAPVPLTQAVAGTYSGEVVLPAPGTWRVQVSLRVSEFANPVGELEFFVPG